MTLLQRAAELERGLAFTFSGGPGHGQQGVGDFGHCADHDYWLFGQASLDDGSNAVDGLRVFYGSATKLHHDHRRSVLGGIVKPGCRAEQAASGAMRARSFAPPEERLGSEPALSLPKG